MSDVHDLIRDAGDYAEKDMEYSHKKVHDVTELQEQNSLLRKELRDCHDELSRQKQVIDTQYEQLSRLQRQLQQEKRYPPAPRPSEKINHQMGTDSTRKRQGSPIGDRITRMILKAKVGFPSTPTRKDDSHQRPHSGISPLLSQLPFCSSLENHPGDGGSQTISDYLRTGDRVSHAVEEIHRWLLVDGGSLKDIPTLLGEYAALLNRMGIPVARLFCGFKPHPKINALAYKWEEPMEEGGSPLIFSREIPKEKYVMMNSNPKEPLSELASQKTDCVRVTASADDAELTERGLDWFRSGNYQDYIALPMFHRGEYKGGMAWSTKRLDGFSEEDVRILRQSWEALSTVIRLHSNDIVLLTLMGRLEAQVADRTAALAKANQELNKVSRQIAAQAQRQLQHFAMVSSFGAHV